MLPLKLFHKSLNTVRQFGCKRILVLARQRVAQDESHRFRQEGVHPLGLAP